jgi:hypothetical protein
VAQLGCGKKNPDNAGPWITGIEKLSTWTRMPLICLDFRPSRWNTPHKRAKLREFRFRFARLLSILPGLSKSCQQRTASSCRLSCEKGALLETSSSGGV